MALPIVNYEALTPQGDPTSRNRLSSIMQGFQAGFQPAMLQQELQKQQLANALAQIQANYAPQMNEAELAQRAAQTNLLGQEGKYYGQNILSEIASRNAGTGLTEAQTKFLPLKFAIELENQQRQQQRFGNTYQMAKALSEMSPQARETYIANNQQDYETLLRNLGQAALQEQSGTNKSSDLLENLKKQYYPDVIKNPQQQLSQQDQQKLLATGLAKIGNPLMQQTSMDGQQSQPLTLPVTKPGQSVAPLLTANQLKQQQAQQQLKAPFEQTQEGSDRLKKALEMSVNKGLTTEATRRQMEGEIQVESMMNDPGFRSQAVNASKYAGAIGKGKAAIDALKQQNPQAYEDYLSFMNQRMPLLEGRIKGLENIGATHEQMQMLENMHKKTMDSLSSNPEQFLQQLDNFGNALQTVGQSVQKSANPIFDVKRTEGYKPIVGEKSNKSDPLGIRGILGR